MCANYEIDIEEILYDDERGGPREVKESLNKELDPQAVQDNHLLPITNS